MERQRLFTVKKIIAEDDPIQIAKSEHQRYFSDPQRHSYIFGEDALRELDYVHTDPSYSDSYFETIVLNQVRDDLAKMSVDEKYQPYVNEFLWKTSEVRRSINTDGSRIEDITIPNLLDADEVTNEELKRALQLHREQMRSSEAFFDKLIPSVKDTFQERIAELIAAGKLPLSADKIARRSSHSTVRFVDVLTKSSKYTAFHDPRWNLIGIRSDHSFQPSHLYRSYAHEMLHAFAGRTIFASLDYIGEGEDDPNARLLKSSGEISDLRNGFKIYKDNRFVWINEAVTERLEEIVVGAPDGGYEKDRNLLTLLQKMGRVQIPDSMFFDAYFEDYDTSVSPGEAMPKRKALFKAIGEAYSPGMLARLDKLVKVKGIEEALRIMKEDPAAI